jgi:hypothetical protein
MTIFMPLEGLKLADSDRVRQFIDWFARRHNRFAAWVGRGIRSLHDHYVTLEDRIDPVERMLKAMAYAGEFVVHTSNPADFYSVLRRQRWKHVFWFSIDFVITGVVIVFTPVLAPIPGPNVFFYYPFLRLLSHYAAIRGALSAMRSRNVKFRTMDSEN